MFRVAFATAILAGLSLSAPALAGPVTALPDQAATFQSFADPGPGTHGLELRGGDSAGRATWEAGLGPQTSVGGRFDQSQVDWEDASGLITYNFFYDYTLAGAEFYLWTGMTRPADPIVEWPSASITETTLPEAGNAIEIFAKRQATITITELDGHVMNTVIGETATDGSEAVVLVSDLFMDGFTMSGTLSVRGGRNSAYGILIKAGNVAPIPLPAALPLMLAALGGLAALRRRA